MWAWAEMPRSPGHVFYNRLQKLLGEAGFDAFVCDARCRRGLFRSRYSNAKIRFQSFFMLMIIQPSFFASSYSV